MNKVYFASSHVTRLAAEATLPAKFERLLAQQDFESMFKDKTVAVKMHVGGGIGYTTIHPIFVRMVLQRIKQAGGRPFCCDGSFSVAAARDRGYTEEVLGAPIIGVGGVTDNYNYVREVGFDSLNEIELSGNIVDADAMLVLSHGKGHGHSAFGGAIKNIAMGCVSCKTRGAIHGLMAGHFEWNEEACTECHQCADNCPTQAIKFTEDGKFGMNEHHCRYCFHCVEACPVDALHIDQSRFRAFQDGMALTVQKCLETFQPNSVHYITVLMNITPLCDCWGFSLPALVPDVGITASDNIVAIEQASLDLIGKQKYIEGSLPDQMELGPEGLHLFQRVHNKDPYMQVVAASELGLGSREYELIEVQ
jgi:uncharacterized Fe-S center protein